MQSLSGLSKGHRCFSKERQSSIRKTCTCNRAEKRRFFKVKSSHRWPTGCTGRHALGDSKHRASHHTSTVAKASSELSTSVRKEGFYCQEQTFRKPWGRGGPASLRYLRQLPGGQAPSLCGGPPVWEGPAEVVVRVVASG